MQTTLASEDLHASNARLVRPGSFDPPSHFYPRVLNAHLHPMVGFFLRMSQDRIVSRYCHLRPRVAPETLRALLSYEPKYLRWAGTDLFHTTTTAGNRRIVVIETNSCPSGNKSMPIVTDDAEQGGYRTLLEHSFLPLVQRRPRDGALAVLYDKNYVENSGYAAALADLTGEDVLLTPYPDGAPDPPARFTDGLLEVRAADNQWVPVRAAFRYVTQRPWNRIPIRTKTRIFNPIIACLAGGRNKLLASKAYDLYNAELEGTGLQIFTPETVNDISKEEVPLWVRKFGGYAVVKEPYSNAGQGVFTIARPGELDAFMAQEGPYDRYVVQSLVGNASWTSRSSSGRLYHVGTMPNRHGEIFVADLRMMVAGGPDGFRPLAIYARRAAAPLPERVPEQFDSWEALGTNLSEKQTDGGWKAHTERLLMMDTRDFNRLGLGPDELVEAYIQSVLATIAIDKMAQTLLNTKGLLRTQLFRSLDDDPRLLEEMVPSPAATRPPPGAD